MNAATGKMATVSGDSHFLEEQMNPTRIKQQLDSSRDYDKAKGMKWLLAMMSKGCVSRTPSRPGPGPRGPGARARARARRRRALHEPRLSLGGTRRTSSATW